MSVMLCGRHIGVRAFVCDFASKCPLYGKRLQLRLFCFVSSLPGECGRCITHVLDRFQERMDMLAFSLCTRSLLVLALPANWRYLDLMRTMVRDCTYLRLFTF